MADGKLDSDEMTVEKHAIRVGYIHTNLAALESSLRFFLLKADRQTFRAPKAGDVDAPLNWMSKWISLGDLIKRYNNRLSTAERGLFLISQESTDIRDAFAHGRIYSLKPAFPWTLTKFGKKKGERVPIDFNKQITVQWLDESYKLIGVHKDKVVACCKARGFSIE